MGNKDHLHVDIDLGLFGTVNGPQGRRRECELLHLTCLCCECHHIQRWNQCDRRREMYS